VQITVSTNVLGRTITIQVHRAMLVLT